MIIQQIRNATVKVRYSGIVFLTDPWLQEQGAGPSVEACRPEMEGVHCPMIDLPDTPENILKDVDYCLITHLHFDHFSADHLPKEMKLIAQNKEDADALRSMGFQNIIWFETGLITIENISIRKTKAVHGDNETVAKMMGETSGYVLKAPGEKTLYLAGDTVYCPTVEEVLLTSKPEVIILNCCGARLSLGRLIMDLTDIEQVYQKAPEATVIASHLDTVNHAQFTSDDVKNFVQEKDLHQVIVASNGEVITA